LDDAAVTREKKMPEIDPELVRLSDEATPGPWPVEYVEWAVRHIVRNVDHPGDDEFPEFSWTYHDKHWENVTHPDARLIVAAVNDLRARIEAQRG
jgi:hypothetical protein